MGLELDDDVEIRVWDSSSEVRYLVLPERPEGTDGPVRGGAGCARDPRCHGRRGPGGVSLSELPVELAITGPAAPPRLNGEMVFEAPWESRLFGMTLALVEADRFAWGEFQQRLIAAIGRWEAEHPDGEGYRYYDCWAEALRIAVGRSRHRRRRDDRRAGAVPWPTARPGTTTTTGTRRAPLLTMAT